MKNENQSSIQNIEKRAFCNIYSITDLESLTHYLKIWWSSYYQRPAKDPLLDEYTVEELLLEYFEQNLYNNKKRLQEIEQEWILNAMSDEEFYKLMEEEVGHISDAVNEHGEVHDKF